MPNRKVIISEKELQYMRLLRSQKVSYRSIASTFGYSLNVVREHLQKDLKGGTDIPSRKKGYGGRDGKIEFLEDDLKIMVEMYANGTHIAKIARHFNVSRDTMRRRLGAVPYEMYLPYL